MTGRWLVIAFLATSLALWPLAACRWGTPGAGWSGIEPIAIRAKFEKAVATFKPVKMTVSITGHPSRLKTPAQVWAEVALPPSMVFINGLLSWKGTVAPGETKSFESTVAIVLEGDSIAHLTASYSFKDFLGNQTSGGVSEAASIRATASGGELNPKASDAAATTTPVRLDPNLSAGPQGPRSYGPLDSGAAEDDVLLNDTESQRLIVFPNVNHGRASRLLEETGLAPSMREDIPSNRGSRMYGRVVGQFLRDDNAAVIALFDRRRPTTGFHLSIVTVYVGAEALRIVGRTGLERNIYLFDYVATAPRPDWPVERRAVSPYAFYPLGWPPDQKSMEIYFRINGEIVGKQDIALDPDRETRVEIPVQFSMR